MRAHEAGWAHAAVSVRGPAWLREPGDANALVPQLWSQTARKVDGVLEVGGVRLTDLVARARLPGVRPRRGRLPRPGPGLPRRRSPTATSTTRARPSSARRSPGGSPRRGSASTSAPAASSRSPSAPGFPMERVGFHGNNKTVAELERAVELGVGRIIVDSFHEIARLTEVVARELGRRRAVMVRVTAGVEAHTHEYIATAHEDQKFGFSISSGDALEAVRQIHAAAGPRAARPALPHRLADLRLLRLRGGRTPGARPARPDLRARSASQLPELDLGGGFGIAYTTQDDPSDAAQLATEMTKIVRDECRGPRPRGAAALDRARPRDRRAGDVHRLRGRHGQGGRARRRRGAHLRLGRRRDERQHPHRALRRRLLLHAGQPRLRRADAADPAWSASTARPATSSSRTSSCPATSRPATWSPCPAPAPTAARWPATTTTRCGRRWSRSRDGESRVVVRRETLDDLLATRRRTPSAADGRLSPR